VTRWPEPGALPKISISEIPAGSTVWGMAPLGIRWTARMTKSGIRPDGNCPSGEFVPCYAEVVGELKEVA